MAYGVIFFIYNRRTNTIHIILVLPKNLAEGWYQQIELMGFISLAPFTNN